MQVPEIQRKKHERRQPKAEDVIVKTGKIRLYFQNYYTILSLGNDLLLGGLYFLGSLVTVFNGPEWVRQYSYLAGAFFMLMRPLLKIFRNVFIYRENEFQEKIASSEYLEGEGEGKDNNDENKRNENSL